MNDSDKKNNLTNNKQELPKLKDNKQVKTNKTSVKNTVKNKNTSNSKKKKD